MNTKPLILSIDIGNTNGHLGLVDTQTLRCAKTELFSANDIAGSLQKALSLLTEGYETNSLPVVISSVNKSICNFVSEELGKCNFHSVSWVHWHDGLPISTLYKSTGKLGSDRIANCLYAHAVHPEQSQIIICSGTATTIDFLRSGKVFAGGAILPGILTQGKSLKDNTHELPFVNLETNGIAFPGTNTEECIRAGVVLGTIGAIMHIVKKYKDLFGDNCLVLAGGGAWKYLKPYIDFEHIYVDNLTLLGTALYYQEAS